MHDILSICVPASIDDQKICRKVPYPKSNCVFVVNLKDENGKDLSCDDSGPYNKYLSPTVVVETMSDNNKLVKLKTKISTSVATSDVLNHYTTTDFYYYLFSYSILQHE